MKRYVGMYKNKTIFDIISEEVNLISESIYGFKKTPIYVTEENYDEALKLRERFSLFKDIGVGTFLTTVFLWRCVDEIEYNIIMKTGKIVGGNWSIPPEKYFGASFTGSRDDALIFGKGWKKNGRLKGKLYIFGINGKDKEFLNLAMVERLKERVIKYEVGDFLIDSSLGDRGLGFSVRDVTLDDVRFIYFVDEENDRLEDITFDVL